jgi:hypothetical protein
MQKLPIDPLAEIGRKFKNPLDIVAFELSSKNAKYAVEKYNLYREWEKRKMPNDDLRIIATKLSDGIHPLIFSFKNITNVIKCSYVNPYVVRVTILPEYLKQIRPNILNLTRLEGDERLIRFDYEYIYFVYLLIESGFSISYQNFEITVDLNNIGMLFNTTRNSGFKTYEDFCFKNEKYRILSLYVALNYKFKIFRKGEQTISADDAYNLFKFIPAQIGFMSYYLLENGWAIRVDDNEEDQYRVVRNCINCNVETDLIEKNGRNVFCSKDCQREYHFSN